jgi:thiol-disulfide isomerase/thioredoxin
MLVIALAATIFACSSRTPESAPTVNNSVPAGPAESPEIHIEVQGMQAGTAYLIATYTDQRYRLDSAQVDATGKMLFKRAEPYPQGLLFAFMPDQSAFQIMVDEDQTFTMKTQKGNYNAMMTVEGSLTNEIMYRTLKFEDQQRMQFDAVAQRLRAVEVGSQESYKIKAEQVELTNIRKKFLDDIFAQYPNNLFTKFKMAGQNPDAVNVFKADGVTIDTAKQVYLYRTNFWEGVDFSDDRLLATPVIANKLKRYITELTPQNADSIISATKFLVDKVLDKPEYFKYFTNYIALYYEPGKTPVMDPNAIFVFIAQNYFTKERAFWTDETQVEGIQKRAFEQQASLVGKKGPDVKAKDPNGKMRSIYEIKDPYILVVLFNPQCEHCIEEAPQLVRLHQEWKPKGLEVFTIAIETNDAEWKGFLAKNGMQNMINVYDPTNRAIYATYYVDNTPELYLLNPDRTIIAKNLKPHQVVQSIEIDMRKRGK